VCVPREYGQTVPTASQKNKTVCSCTSRIVIDTPFEVDSSRCVIGRSPGLRLVGLKLPSQCIAAPVAYSLRSSTLTVAGAAPDLHRIPMQHQVPSVIRQVRESSQVGNGRRGRRRVGHAE
jgi:hypothetical protein